jgi:AcrR family transcriptional regulator
VTTRAVCEAAGVTAPTLYHHFGDKDGLVAAVIARTVDHVLLAKAAVAPTGDPVEDVRRGWDAWVAFALAHPALSALAAASPRAAPEGTAAAYARLRDLLARVDSAARLAVPLPLALEAVWAAAQGVTALLVQRAYADRPLDDVPRVSATLRDAVLGAVTTA